MAELLKVNVTKDELEEGTIPQNYVLCKMHYKSEGAKTKSGIIYGINVENVYQDADNLDDDSSHAADMAETASIVVKLPERLYFNPDDEEHSMPWETEMELNEDDIVFTNPIESLNAITLVCEGENYKLLPYQDLYCAKREIWVDKWTVPPKKKEIVVMLNGFVLCTQLNKESLSVLDVTSEDKIDKARGVVAYIGQPNQRYLRPEYTDMEDLQVGDEVLFDKRYAPTLLERQKYNSQFDSEMLYWVVQRRKIAMVLKRR